MQPPIVEIRNSVISAWNTQIVSTILHNVSNAIGAYSCLLNFGSIPCGFVHVNEENEADLVSTGDHILCSH